MNFNEICEAENATLSGNATEDSNHSGFSGSGFVAGLDELGSSIAWELNNDLAEGDYNITLRYTNGLAGDGQHTARTLSLFVDGVKSQISVPATNDWADWSTFQKSVNLGTGPHTIKLSCEEGDTYHVNVDWIAVSPFGEDVPETIVSEDNMNIGGWVRSLDLKSGGVPLWDGLMSKAGWYLIDDSRTA
jgi:hypothetical protein